MVVAIAVAVVLASALAFWKNVAEESIQRAESVAPGGDITAKAFTAVVSTPAGSDPSPANINLKILATSAGLMPSSTPMQLDTYRRLKAAAEGPGVLYLLDAKLLTLQFPFRHADPEQHNNDESVPYRRQPDEPEGKPVYDVAGNLVMKTQAELLPLGYAGAEYTLRHSGQYSNVHLSVLADNDAPIYLAYLHYSPEAVNSEPQFKILLAKGSYKNGKYSARKIDGSDFTDRDYRDIYHYNASSSDRFREISGPEFEAIVASVHTVVAVGGITFLTIRALSPSFHDRDGAKMPSQPNPYGRAVLDRVKDGKAVYVGQSAGTVALSYAVGPLTKDTSYPELDPEEKVDIEHGLGLEWLFPDLGQYLGIPYRLVFRPHLRFDLSLCAYEANVLGVVTLGQAISGGVRHDVYGAILADYDFHAGKGDLVEVSHGKVLYHVGYTSQEEQLPAPSQRILSRFTSRWSFENRRLRMQPWGNPSHGWTFDWQPQVGEVFAAGPKASQPFHLYASTSGPFPDAPPMDYPRHGKSQVLLG
uniref:Amine oxidase n=1 Tax=Pyrodinium bahamense TaxID=73915 RepID=A0A7S0FVZ8_9DINO